MGSSATAARATLRARWAPAFRLPVTTRGLPLLVAALDTLLILASALAGGDITHFTVPPMAGETTRTVFVGVMGFHKSYEPHRLADAANERLRLPLLTWTGAFLLLMSGAFAWGVGRNLSRGAIAEFFVLGAAALIGRRLWWRRNLPDALGRGALRRRACALVCGAPEDALRLRPSLERQGYQMARTIVAPDGKLEAAAEALRGQAIDVVPAEGLALDMHAAAWVLRALPIPVALVPDPALAALAAKPRYQLGETLALEIQREPFSLEERAAKRALDLVVAGAALVALAPLMAAIALAIRLESPGRILFRQTRGGFNGLPFQIIKFRSMRVAEDGAEVKQARRQDPRVTRVGAVLRRTSLDELPQLFNVLRGEMSLVGPRPHAMKHDGEFAARVENYAFRHHVKAGVTGWAQVHGARGPIESVEQIRRRVELDLWYVEHWSLTLDFFILLRTLGAVIHGRNAV